MSLDNVAPTLEIPPTLEMQVDALLETAAATGYQDVARVKSLSEEAYALAKGDGETPVYLQGMIASTISLMKCCGYFGDLAQGIRYAQTLEPVIDIENVSPGTMDFLMIASSLYYNSGNYPKALEYGLRMLKFADTAPTVPRWQVNANNIVGAVYNYLEDYAAARKYQETALKAAQQQKDPVDIAMCQLNLAESYRASDDFDAAYDSATAALLTFEQVGILQAQALSLNVIGQVLQQREQHDQAESIFQRALTAARASHARAAQMSALNALARLRLTQKNADAAITLLKEALTLGENTPAAINLARCHEVLAHAYAQKGDFAQAYAHYVQFHSQDRALFDTKSDERIQTLTVIHQLELAQKESEIYRLRSEALEVEMAARAQAEQQKIAEIGESERIKALQTFFTNATHDLFTPITTLKTNLYLLQRTQDATQLSNRINTITKVLNDLQIKLERMMLMTRLDNPDTRNFQFDRVVVFQLLEHVLTSFASSGRTFVMDAAPDLSLTADYNYLKIAITCLIDNAIQYSAQDTPIRIIGSTEVASVCVSVEDQGSGISSEDLPRIFERLYRGAQYRPDDSSSGLGLSIAKAIALAHGGSIKVKSDINKGTRVTLVLPQERRNPGSTPHSQLSIIVPPL